MEVITPRLTEANSKDPVPTLTAEQVRAMDTCFTQEGRKEDSAAGLLAAYSAALTLHAILQDTFAPPVEDLTEPKKEKPEREKDKEPS